jgi:cold shock CspA family protein
MLDGTIKEYYFEERCGVITPDLGGPDVSFHASVAYRFNGDDRVYRGEKCQYSVTEGPEGPTATEVRVRLIL